MKYKKGCIIILVILLTTLTSAKGEIMKSTAPAHTLETFKIDGKVIYLVYLAVPSQYEQDSGRYNTIGSGDFFVIYDIVQGDYPENYSDRRYSLHVIPENSHFILEQRLESYAMYAGDEIGHRKPSLRWEAAGYSTDKNNIAAKVFEYFQKQNK